jgi:murein DD-endopeptidase MepM/ murein hydrolase activator NlpD
MVPAVGSDAASGGWAGAPSPFTASDAEVAGDAPIARASSSLQRSLAAQTRFFAASSDLGTAAAAVPSAAPAKPARPASAKAAPAKAAPAKAAPAKKLTLKPGAGPLWERLPVLEPGAEGDAVAFLQFKLQTKKTGWYGPMTLEAVKAYQVSRGLPAKGYVGALTWRAILTKAKPVATATTSSSPSSRGTGSSRGVVRAPVTAGKVCPSPGAAFGSGWGAQRAGHLHQGVDLVARRGAPIVAVESGYIMRAGTQGNGAIRIVQQGASGAKYFYGHMDSITVGSGSRVSRGQIIGYMGDTGSPGAVHLHFEYWPSGRESAAVDPFPLLKSLCW